MYQQAYGRCHLPMARMLVLALVSVSANPKVKAKRLPCNNKLSTILSDKLSTVLGSRG
jgi:hypothetical protein